MPVNDRMSEKKRALIAYKEKILQEIKYHEKRIEDMRSRGLGNSFFEDGDSSDSEADYTIPLNDEPTLRQLQQQQGMLRTCLQATQELTSLQVLEAEVNVLVDDPEIIGEKPVTEPGVWREVTAECRVDLVPFSITFYVHQQERKFGAWSYRGLRVVPVKKAHEGELSRSVLPTLTLPSDAVEVLKSYAAAQRSRRSSLARLADKFANTLYMEPMSDGGYVLKCANLLEVSWTLQNKWSPIAPFHHRLKFDLEYMDESYIKTITQVHRQLSDPSIDTDERTLLLAKIISTCLEAQGPTQELYESMSSDPEAASLRQRRTTLDREPEAPASAPRQDSSGVMAPPKTLPKRAKPKGKENMGENHKESLKRGNSSEDMNKNKKLKADTNSNQGKEENGDMRKKNTEENINNEVKSTNSNNKNGVASNKSNEAKKVAGKNNTATTNKVENTNNVASAKTDVDKETTGKSVEKAKPTKEKSDLTANKDTAKKTNDLNKPIKNKIAKEKSDLDSNNVASTKNTLKTADTDKNVNKPKMVKEKSNDKLKNDGNIKKAKDTETDQNMKETQNVEKGEKTKNVKDKKDKDSASNVNKKTEDSTKPKKSNNAEVINRNEQINKKQVPTEKEATEKPKVNKNKEKDTKINENSDKKNSNDKVITKSKDNIENTNNVQNKESKESTLSKETERKQSSAEKRPPKDAPGSADKKKNVATEKKDVNKQNSAKNTDKNKVVSTKSSVEKQNSGKIAEKTVPKQKSDVPSKNTGTKIVDNVKVQEKAKVIANNNKKIDVQKKSLTKNDKKADANIDSTVDKVVEKSIATKRKSNLQDIDNVASGKITKNPEIRGGDKNSKIAPVKRKSNFVDNNVASAKKRALNGLESVRKPTEATQMKKTNSDNKMRSENYQKPVKIDKMRTKLTPGFIKTVSGNTKVLNAGNTGSDKKVSKIPQKKLPSISETLFKKNPLRISPRKIPSKFKTTDAPKSIQKATTSIPRLLKKPVTKT